MLNLEVKTLPKKKLTLVEIQQLPNNEKVDSKDDFFRLCRKFKMVGEKYASTFKLLQTR